MFGDDVHGDFGEIEVGANAGGGGDAGFLVNVAEHGGDKIARGGASVFEVIGDVAEDFVDGVGKEVVGGEVVEVDLVNFG